ncbi:MAG: TlpA disulfide reductase family protein [Actinomycetota bacterium]
MKRTLLGIALSVALVAAACSGATEQTATTTETDVSITAEPAGDHTPAPALAFLRFDGSEATFADYAGQPLVVNFWASWCPSCVAELSAAFRPVQEAVGDEVAFLGINLQDDRADALRLVDETGIAFDLAEDVSGDLYLELGGIGMPFTVFIDSDGNVVEEHNGPLTEAQLLAMIEEAFSL